MNVFKRSLKKINYINENSYFVSISRDINHNLLFVVFKSQTSFKTECFSFLFSVKKKSWP